jgi:uncharacterized protein (TIGR03000 family)
MSNRILWGTTVAAFVAGGLLCLPATSDAQRRGGWGWGPGGYDPWGYHSGGTRTPAASSGYQAAYPAERLISADAGAGFTVRLPDPNAEVWFDSYQTQQRGTVRQYVSGRLEPEKTYTYRVRARWMENGRPVEQTRSVDVRAGQQVTVDFTSAAKQ